MTGIACLPKLPTFRKVRQWMLLVLATSAWLGGSALAQSADDVDLRLHCAWGGGQDRQWSGRFSLSSGVLSELQLLGVDPDQPGSVQLHGQQILIRQRQPRGYDGLEVSVRGPADAEVRIELLATGELTPQIITVPLSELIAGYRSEPLDEQSNRLVLRRAPGDLIRVTLPHSRLVFSPGDTLNLELRGHRLGVPADTALRSRAALRSRNGGELIWENEYRHRADAAGSWPNAESIRVDLPSQEGVYHLEVEIATRRRAAPFTADKVLAQRHVQLVVVGTQALTPAAESEASRLVLEVDPTQANWWHRVARLPQWTLLPGSRTDGPLGNLKPQRTTLGDRDWLQLPVGGWQAYPLPIDEIGALHELTLEFPEAVDQTFAISVVEANAAGKVIPVGLDSGVRRATETVESLAIPPTSVAQHRLRFWPKTRSPLMLITNLSDTQPAQYGRFQVDRRTVAPQPLYSGPDHRKVVALFERPLFPEAFGAAETLDPATGRSLEDWETFLTGSVRMIEYARSVGYDGLAVACASEGSSLYPSRLLQPTPKHDRGIFFSNGQDPVRKDVLELMFRLCDREQIQLIPLIEFATPLPELERQLALADQSEGIALVDLRGHRSEPVRGRAAYYNPLDERVQTAMRDVIRELLERYRSHPSFGGLCISLQADGFSQLPDAEWGLDPFTWERFRRERQIRSATPTEMDELARDSWLDWRCQQMGAFYRQVARDVHQARPGSPLYLAGARLIDSRPIQRVCKPSLPPRADTDVALRELGLHPRYLQGEPNLVFLRPRLFLAEDATSAAAIHAFNEDEAVDTAFQSSAITGSQLLHDPQLLRIPSFDEVSPFGKNNTFMSLVAQVSPVGQQNRQRFIHSLARDDAEVIFEGGWMVPLGQEEPLREFFETYRQLPRGRYQTIELQRQPLTIRRLSTADSTTLYVVNDSPWHVGANLGLDVMPDVKFKLLGGRQQLPTHASGSRVIWNLTLAPYDLVAVRADRPNVNVVDADVNLPPQVPPSLEKQIQQLGLRAGQLRNPRPLSLLQNAAFEEWDAAGQQPLAWTVRAAPGVVTLDRRDKFQGDAALHIRLPNGSAGLRSASLVPPSAGRLSISLRAKVPGSSQQPRVRLVLEVDGKTWYPWSPIGVGADGRTLTNEWKEFVFRVSELPQVEQSFRVGLEVGGAGEVLIDDLQFFDILVLDHSEQNALGLLLTEADRLRRRGQVSDCLRLLEGYWPQYLLKHLPELENATAPAAPLPLTETADPAGAEREAATWLRMPWLRPRR